MSRTRKGRKGDGYDYWGRRALSTSCSYGPEVKKITNRIERRRGKQRVRQERYDELRSKEAI